MAADQSHRPTALVGRDGWLFLSGDTNSTLLHSTGQREVSEATVRGWHRLLEYRHAWLAQRGIRFLYAVVPNKEAVYEQHLPVDVPPLSDERLVCRLERRLIDRSAVPFEYLLSPLRDASRSQDVYARTDTHWNGHGAYVAYRRMMDVLGVDTSSVVQEDQLSVTTSLSQGDLGSKLVPPVESEFTHCKVRAGKPLDFFDNGIVNNGRVRRTEWKTTHDGPKVLVFHDSFYNWLLPLFAETFPITVSVHNFRFDLDVVERERPDVVIGELTERFMARVPDDLTGTMTEDFQRMKTAGEVPSNY